MPTVANISTYTNTLQQIDNIIIQLDDHTITGNTHTLHLTPNPPRLIPSHRMLQVGDFTRIQVAQQPAIYAKYIHVTGETIEYAELSPDAAAIAHATLDTPQQIPATQIADYINTSIKQQPHDGNPQHHVHITDDGPTINGQPLNETPICTYTLKPETENQWALLTVTYPIGELTVDINPKPDEQPATIRGGEIDFCPWWKVHEGGPAGIVMHTATTMQERQFMGDNFFTRPELAAWHKE